MILVDVNILVYAYVPSFRQHERARVWLDAQLSGQTRVGLPWSSLIAFLRIVTNARVFERPVDIADAWRQVRDWLSAAVAWIPEPGERHAHVLARYLATPGVKAGLVHDAHLAALATEHGLTVCSSDGDFARFPGLAWLNPLEQALHEPR